MGRATVHDVARAAGVSLATIDRVLNRRGGVRAGDDREGRAGDLNSSTTGATRPPRCSPSRTNTASPSSYPTGVNTFLGNLAAEVRRLAELARADRAFVSIIERRRSTTRPLAEALRQLEGQSPTGVAVVATDNATVREAIDRLAARGVSVVTLVSDVPASKRAHYVGIDNSAAGRTAASLMGRFLRGEKGRIAIVAGSLLLRDHAERRYGFEQVLRTEYPDLIPLPVIEGLDNAAIAEEALGATLDAP